MYKYSLVAAIALASFSGAALANNNVAVGALHNGNELTGKSKQTASGEYTIGDKKYTVDGQVKAKADWRSFAPYLGLGWGNAIASKSKLSVNADLGIMFTGS